MHWALNQRTGLWRNRWALSEPNGLSSKALRPFRTLRALVYRLGSS
jgi:hypothetical protein